MFMFCLRSFFHSLSSYHHLPSLFFSFPSLLFSPLLSSLEMSQAVLDDDPSIDSDDPPMDFNDLEDDVGPTMPPPSAPLSLDAVTKLSHDELRHNPEFMKYVNLVDALLLTVRSNTSSPSGKHFFFSLSHSSYSLIDKPQPLSHPYLRPCLRRQATQHRKSGKLVQVACHNTFSILDPWPVPPSTLSRFSGLSRTARTMLRWACLLATGPAPPCTVLSITTTARSFRNQTGSPSARPPSISLVLTWSV